MATQPDAIVATIEGGKLTLEAPTTEGRESGSGKSFNLVKTGMKGIPVKIKGGEYDGVVGKVSMNVYVTKTAIEEAKL